MNTRHRKPLEKQKEKRSSTNASEPDPAIKTRSGRRKTTKSTETIQTRSKTKDTHSEEFKEAKQPTGRIRLAKGHDFYYPPDRIQFMPTKCEFVAAQTSKDSANFLTDQWLDGKNCVLIDESKSIKYAAVSMYIEKLRIGYSKCPPFLLITRFTEILSWVEQFKYWTTQKSYIFSTLKAERPSFPDSSIILENTTLPEDCGILIVSGPQFIRDPSALPRSRWGSIILDEPEGIISIGKVEGYHRTFVNSFIEDDYPPLNEFLGIQPNMSIDSHSIHTITCEDAANENLYEENLALCPLTKNQQIIYLNLLNESKAKMQEDPTIEFMGDLGRKLRFIGSHHFLIQDNLTEVAASSSGKTQMLLKIINHQKLENKKTVILCYEKAIPVLSAVLKDQKINYQTSDGSADSVARAINEFNSQSEFAILVIPDSTAVAILKKSMAETIVAFDTDWTAPAHAEHIVAWHARLPRAQIYRLIAQNTYEQIAFEYFWRNRDCPPLVLEDSDRDTLYEILKKTYKLAKEKMEHMKVAHRLSLRDIKPLPYSDTTLFPETALEWDDAFWNPPVRAESVKTAAAKPAKPPSPGQFWNSDNLLKYLEKFCGLGWGHFEAFADEFKRPPAEYERLAVLTLKILMKNEDEGEFPSVIALCKEHGKFDQKRLLSSISCWDECLSKINGKQLLIDVENQPFLAKLIGEAKDASEINISSIEDLFLTKDIEPDEARQLMMEVHSGGYSAVDLSKANALREVLKTAKARPKAPKRPPRRSGMIVLRAQKTKFDHSAHEKVLNGLMNYGFPDVERFMNVSGLQNYAPEAVQNYVDNVIKYCTANAEERRSISPHLVSRIVKYHTQKIPTRIALFERIRAAATDYDNYSAEDIEFLEAAGFHGFLQSQSSPVLTCACRGLSTEIKLHTRAKTIFEETRRQRVQQKLSEDILNQLPIRISDMMMLLSLGEIDPEFCNSDYVYPIGYKVAVVTASTGKPELLEWHECEICSINHKLVFAVRTLGSEENLFEGTSPDDVFEQYRARLARRASIPVYNYDGHEMFGLTSALVHRLIKEMPGIEKCTAYRNRFFSTVFNITGKWPIIGQFEKEPEVTVEKTVKAPSSFKYRKRVFGDLLQPLVLDCGPLAAADRFRFSLDFASPSPSVLPESFLEAFDAWGDFSGFLPQ